MNLLRLLHQGEVDSDLGRRWRRAIKIGERKANKKPLEEAPPFPKVMGSRSVVVLHTSIVVVGKMERERERERRVSRCE